VSKRRKIYAFSNFSRVDARQEAFEICGFFLSGLFFFRLTVAVAAKSSSVALSFFFDRNFRARYRLFLFAEYFKFFLCDGGVVSDGSNAFFSD